MNVNIVLRAHELKLIRCSTQTGVWDGKSQFRSEDLDINIYLDADDLIDLADHFQRLSNALRDEEARVES